jgi:hypothetical protein
MVYEYLPVKIAHHNFEVHRVYPFSDASGSLQLVWKTLSGLEILVTCRQVNAESMLIIQRRLEGFRREPIRLTASLATFSPYGPLDAIIPYLLAIPRRTKVATQDLRRLLRLQDRAELDANSSWKMRAMFLVLVCRSQSSGLPRK